MGNLGRRLGRLEEQIQERLETVLVEAMVKEEIQEFVAILRVEVDPAIYRKVVRVVANAGYLEIKDIRDEGKGRNR